MRTLVVVVAVPLGDGDDPEAEAARVVDSIPNGTTANQRLGQASYAVAEGLGVRPALASAIRAVRGA